MTTYDYEDEETYILDDLIRFADHNKSINRTFIDDTYDFMDKFGYITDSQLQILKEIYHQNKVDEYFNRFE